MKFIDLTLPTPAQNLACDEALLDFCEQGFDDEILRFWESPQPFVVLGYSNRADTEARRALCQKDNIPILRRCTGGGTVLQGPGCLNFSLVLRIPESNGAQFSDPSFVVGVVPDPDISASGANPTPMKGALPSAAKGISATNDFIIKSHEAALRPLLGPVVQKQGASDLALGPLKFSGNAQRRKRNFLLYHGTFLLDFDLPLIERLLPLPSRQPDYRRNRSHEDFLTNVSLPAREIKRRLQQLWRAADPLKELPLAPIDRLAVSRYASDDWNFKF